MNANQALTRKRDEVELCESNWKMQFISWKMSVRLNEKSTTKEIFLKFQINKS